MATKGLTKLQRVRDSAVITVILMVFSQPLAPSAMAAQDQSGNISFRSNANDALALSASKGNKFFSESKRELKSRLVSTNANVLENPSPVGKFSNIKPAIDPEPAPGTDLSYLFQCLMAEEKACLDAGNYEDSVPINKRIFDILKRLSPDQVQKAISFEDSVAWRYFENGYWSQARFIFERIMVAKRLYCPAVNLDDLRQLDAILQIYSMQNKLDSARTIALKEVSFSESKVPYSERELVSSLLHLGSVYRLQGHSARALGSFNRAISLLKNSTNANLESSEYLKTLAMLCTIAGNTKDAENCYQKLLTHSDTREHSVENRVAALLGIADIHNDAGDYSQAEKFYRLVIGEATIEGLDLSRAILGLIDVSLRQGKTEEIKDLQMQLIELGKRIDGNQLNCWYQFAEIARIKAKYRLAEIILEPLLMRAQSIKNYCPITISLFSKKLIETRKLLVK